MDGNSEVPLTREILGAHLYQKVCECFSNGEDNPTLSQKLTGMLMECNTADLLLMLTDDHLLKMRIETAKLSLGDNLPKGHSDKSNEKLDLGDELFEKVKEIDSDLSAQLTGMLLELDQTTLKELLSDNSKLLQAVEKSKQSFLKHHSFDIDNGDRKVSEQDETTICAESNEEVGEILYAIVESIYPKEAAQITGMLLEIEQTVLQKLLQDQELLMKKINMAREVLQSHLPNSL